LLCRTAGNPSAVIKPDKCKRYGSYHSTPKCGLY
jgi:hypothetical protein